MAEQLLSSNKKIFAKIKNFISMLTHILNWGVVDWSTFISKFVKVEFYKSLYTLHGKLDGRRRGSSPICLVKYPLRDNSHLEAILSA